MSKGQKTGKHIYQVNVKLSVAKLAQIANKTNKLKSITF